MTSYETPTRTVRVYELARELGVDAPEIIKAAGSVTMEPSGSSLGPSMIAKPYNSMSRLSLDEADAVRRQIKRRGSTRRVEESSATGLRAGKSPLVVAERGVERSAKREKREADVADGIRRDAAEETDVLKPVGWVIETTGKPGGIRNLRDLGHLPFDRENGEPVEMVTAFPEEEAGDRAAELAITYADLRVESQLRALRARVQLAALNGWRFASSWRARGIIEQGLRRIGISEEGEEFEELETRILMGAFRLEMAVNGNVGAPARSRAARLAKQMVRPPTTTPNNIEIGVMASLHYLCTAFGDDQWTMMRVRSAYVDASDDPALRSSLLFAWRSTQLLKQLKVSKEWRQGWYANGFPKVEVGHKLAASLCLTDVPQDLDVKAPWPAWSLVLPDGLLGGYARVWCLGTSVHATLSKGENGDRSLDPEIGDLSGIDGQLLSNLVRGVCLAMSEPKEFQKRSGSSGKAKRKGGAPDFEQVRFLLSAAVTVDLRSEVAEARAVGQRPGGAPTVQFLVRGHWRSQPCGTSRRERKVIWIQPFWKGPEHGRVLLRPHTVREAEAHKD